MQNITKEYLVLFTAVTEAEEALQSMREKLIAAQQLAEDVYLAGSEDETEKAAS